MAYPPPSPVNFDFIAQGYNPPTWLAFDFGAVTGSTGASCTQQNLSSTGALAQTHALSGADAAQQNVSPTQGLTETFALYGTDSLQGNLSSSGSIVYVPPVHRYLTSNWTAAAENTAIVRSESAVARGGTALSAAKTCAVRDVAAPLQEGFEARRLQTWVRSIKVCADRATAARLLNGAESIVRALIQASQSHCFPAQDAQRLAAITNSVQPTVAFKLVKTRGVFEDASQTRRSELRDYYRNPQTPYVISQNFNLPLSSYSNVTVTKYKYFPPATPFVFDFKTPGYPPPLVLVFDFANSELSPYSHIYRVYGEPAAPYAPSADFVLPYTSALVIAHVNDEYGLAKSDFYSSWQLAKRLDVKKCSLQQKARPAPSGTSSPVDPPRPPVVDPPGHIIVTIPTKQVYSMLHTASVTLLNGTPVAMNNLSLSHNADSFAWQFSGELLRKEDIALLTQSGGTPVQLVVTINGVVFKVIPSPVEHNYRFGQRSITVPGIGLTALLDRPYEQPSSATQGSQLTIQQIAELLLPGGWTLDWAVSMPAAWLIPAEVFTYTQKTPIQALATLAQDIGCALIPARATQTITITPRYPVLPWNFAQLSPDLVIPASAVTGVTHQTVLPEQANGVYVHCNHNQGNAGQIGWCRLNGSDGAKLAPPVGNDFMTDPIALRLLGERILAAYAPQPPIKSFTLPMDNTTFPMLSVGQFVQVTADGQTARGIVNSVSLQYSLSETDINVSQTIQIGEQTPNEWVFFRSLLPGDPLLFASLAATDGETSLMTLLDNGVVRVRGTGTVGNKYFIRAGRIDGEAPNLTQQDIVI
jgi:hypothetical protein